MQMLSLIRAPGVVKCELALECRALRSCFRQVPSRTRHFGADPIRNFRPLTHRAWTKVQLCDDDPGPILSIGQVSSGSRISNHVGENGDTPSIAHADGDVS